MDIIRDHLEEILAEMKNKSNCYGKEIQTCPAGRLTNSKNHGRAAFYHATTSEDGNYKRVRLKESDPMVSALARKEYLEKTLRLINANIGAMQQMLARYESLDPAEIIDGMGRAYRLLDSEKFFRKQRNDLWDFLSANTDFADDDLKIRCDNHRKWAKKVYPKNTFPFPDEKYLTASGIRVRSRGEIIIYDRLDYYGIPHRYDQLISLNDGSTIAPDFSFEDCDMAEFYLEYCGKMNDSGYVTRHLGKRNRYERSGIVPWKNIYYLYSVDNGISVPEIDSVIMNYIIPRL